MLSHPELFVIPVFALHHNFLNDVFNEETATKYREASIHFQNYLVVMKAILNTNQPATTSEDVFTRLCSVSEIDPKAPPPANIWKALEDYVKIEYLTTEIAYIKYEESVIILTAVLSQKGVYIILVSNDDEQEAKIRIYYDSQGRPIRKELPFKVMNARQALGCLAKLNDKTLHEEICKIIGIEPDLSDI